MTDREKQEYKLALQIGHKRFGSICEHRKIKNGYCINCLRKVVVKLRETMRLAIGKDVSKARTAAECMEIAGLDYGLE